MSLVFDAPIHVQPWDLLLPAVRERRWHGRGDRDTVLQMAQGPAALLRCLDAENEPIRGGHACAPS